MIEVNHLSKVYRNDSVETLALNDVSFEIEKGEFMAIMGPSGSGKSTLMHILGSLDKPTSGEYFLEGKDISSLDDDQLAEIRNQKIGFVFQSFNLLPRYTAKRNVILPMIYGDVPKEEREKRAVKFLKMMGLEKRIDHTPAQLSGGEKQRVAIARALTCNPSLILADEPTGNIATDQANEVMKIFQDLNERGHTLVVITHEEDIGACAKRIITIKDGRLVSDKKNKRRKMVGKLII
ncbi:ABC transporter ATP-binding protein [Candidatus Shapirobacteria bacterium]|nr:ABC transporter ATP-binding protein [Candidatus Shapirobacteria bacterium]